MTSRVDFLFFMQPVSLNRLASPLIVVGLGTCRPGNFTRNLRVSEHDFLRVFASSGSLTPHEVAGRPGKAASDSHLLPHLIYE